MFRQQAFPRCGLNQQFIIPDIKKIKTETFPKEWLPWISGRYLLGFGPGQRETRTKGLRIECRKWEGVSFVLCVVLVSVSMELIHSGRFHLPLWENGDADEVFLSIHEHHSQEEFDSEGKKGKSPKKRDQSSNSSIWPVQRHRVKVSQNSRRSIKTKQFIHCRLRIVQISQNLSTGANGRSESWSSYKGIKEW